VERESHPNRRSVSAKRTIAHRDGRAHDPDGRAHDPDARAHDPDARAHDPDAHAHDPGRRGQ